MKRKLSFLILISAAVFFANTAFAQTTETVGDFNGFNAAISSNVPVMTINFSENITVNGNIYEQAAGTLTINGFGYNLDGDNFGSYIVVNNDTQILNISSLTVVNFSSGFSDEAGLTRGGAIFSSGSVNIDSSVFTDNYAQSLSSSSDTFAYGGAVWLNNNFNVSISSFINNFASAAVTENDIIAIAAGGAVYIDSASANAVSITSGLFDGNYAFAQCISSASATAMGGAIYNNATEAFIYNSTFTNNYATALSSAAGTTNACGGAIYNASTLTVVNSYFAFNSINSSGGQALGGAIYNADNAVLYIVADGENTVFEGNKANGRSNAIHNSSGAFVYLNASSGNEIIFNDSISGNLTGEIHINSAAVSSSTGGTVVLNNALTSNSIYLYSGTLSLGNFDGIRDSVSTWTYIANPSRGSIGGTNNADKCDLYISDLAVFNLSNGNATDNVYLRNFSVESGTATLLFDVDLANLRWDTINVSSTLAGSGILDVSKLTILTDISSGVSANVRVIVSTYTPDNNYFAGVDFNLYRYRADLSSSVYHITEGAEFGALNFTLTGYYDDTFQQAVLDTGERTLQLESGYYAGSEYNSVLGTGTFTINAISSGTSAITINGANNTNLFVLSDNNVNLDLINVYIINGSSDTGGAIYNAGSVSVSELVFSGNTAVSSETALGGAVFNDGVFTVQNSSFTYNTASGSVAYGGAVYNSSGAISEIIDTSFINNSAGTSGGAIYNDGGTVNIIAGLENSEFSGNKAAGISNAICVSNGGVINLNAGLAQIIFNDNITSSGNANIININQTGLSFPSSGTIVINADMSGFNNSSGTFSGNTVNFYGGTIQFGSNAVFFNDADFYMYSGATLNMNNGKIDTISLDNFNLPESGEAFVCLDVDLRAASADNFIGTVLSDNTGTLAIKKLFLLNDTLQFSQTISVEIADDTNLISAIVLDTSQQKVMGPIFQYFVNYDEGYLNFEYAHDYNPSVFIAPITMLTGGYLGQLNSYVHGFQSLENVIAGNERKGVWVRPYAYNEDVSLNSKLTVSNNAYGVYFGYDTPVSEIGDRIIGNVSLYGSYNASSQKYEGAEINQDGGIFGVTASLYKKKFFAGVTANLGIISEHGQGPDGKDDFMMYTKGISVKAGYKVDLNYKETFQFLPMLNLSYSSIDMAPYNHVGAVDVEITSDGLTPFHIEPAVKFVVNSGDGFQTYANMSYVWCLSNDTAFKANDIDLPQLSVKPYLQYGVGIYKILGENLSSSAEVYGRSSGRNGVGGHLNIRWSFGR